MKYWDASALIPLFVSETKTPSIQSILKEDPEIITWWSTPVECLSALWRLHRMKAFDDSRLREARKLCDELMTAIDFVTPSRPVRERAQRLLGLHVLRASDALQLAAALRWSQDQTKGLSFVCLDEKLRSAAEKEGFEVLP